MSFSISIKSRDADSTTDFPRWSLDWLRWFLAQPHEDLLTAVRELAQELDDLAETDSQQAFLDARALNRAAREYLRTLGTSYTEDHPLLEETRKILEPHQCENEASERSLRLPRMSGGMLNTIHLEEVLSETNLGLARQAANSSPKVALGIFLAEGLITRAEYEREEARYGRLWTYQGT